MTITLSILILLASVMLIGVVLIQKSKGGGLAASASNYNQFMGVRKTTDFIEKATWGLAIFICVLSIASAFMANRALSINKQQDAPSLENMKNLPQNPGDQAATGGQQTPGGQGGAQ
ncbi:MAG: preprotein translocase subunit SecG [Muribaculaceae bacterium]|nr:preprotein translocase subunit SecG [Muribaculaceae bacterium]